MARMEKDEALGFAKEHGFKILPRSSRGYTIDHDDWKNGQAIPANTYAAALIIMKSFIADQNELIGPADGGNPVAIEAAGQSVAAIQREFDDLVAPRWNGQNIGRGLRRPIDIAERLKLDDLPTIADRASLLPPPDPRTMLMKPDGEKDVRMFYVTARFKKGEHVTHGSLTRNKAFEYAGIFLTNPRVKSVKLGPM